MRISLCGGCTCIRCNHETDSAFSLRPLRRPALESPAKAGSVRFSRTVASGRIALRLLSVVRLLLLEIVVDLRPIEALLIHPPHRQVAVQDPNRRVPAERVDDPHLLTLVAERRAAGLQGYVARGSRLEDAALLPGALINATRGAFARAST